MNWEDERWCKLYTRDSVTWLSWDWRARFVMMSLLRKVDRAGVIDVGSRGVEGLAAILDIPPDIVSDGIAQLVMPNQDGEPTIVWNGPQLVIPRFIEAQESKTSSAARQRASRERRRDFAIRGMTGVPDAHTRSTDDHDPDDPFVTRRDTIVTPRDMPLRVDNDLDDVGHVLRRTPREVVTPRQEDAVTDDRGHVLRHRDDPVSSVLAHFARHFLTANGSKPTSPTRQQRTRVAQFIADVGEQRVKDVITRAFTESFGWPRPPYNLAAILQHFDIFAAVQQPRANGASTLHQATMRSIQQDKETAREPLMPWETEE